MIADLNVFGRVYIGYQGSGFPYGKPAPRRGTPLAQLVAQNVST
jgi:hypothetical protein